MIWKGVACPLVTDLLLHVIHNCLGTIFPVEDEGVEVGWIGVVLGNFHTSEVSNPHTIPDIRNDAATKPDAS